MNLIIRKNPYSFSGPVGDDKFIGRKEITFKIAGKLMGGASIAIIGQPNIGKTSMLLLLSREAVLKKLIGTTYPNLKSNLVDGHTLRGISNIQDFWEYALRPFEKNNILQKLGLQNAYQEVKTNSYKLIYLQEMFREFRNKQFAFFLAVDEFDDFLSNPALNSAEFFGGLRSLVSLSDAFKLIIASRLTIDELQSHSYEYNRTSSPFFNVFESQALGNFKDKEMEVLFGLSDISFSSKDKTFVTKISGKHPYLAQLSCAMLWESYKSGEAETVYSRAAKSIYLQSIQHFADGWRRWSNDYKIALTLVAMYQIPELLSNESFNNGWLKDYISEYNSELYYLEDHGYVTKLDNETWMLPQYAMIWWIGDIIRKGTRKEKEFQTMLQHLFLELPKTERTNFLDATKSVSRIIGKSSLSLIEAFAKGFAEGTGAAYGKL